jgi:hypothetical protein
MSESKKLNQRIIVRKRERSEIWMAAQRSSKKDQNCLFLQQDE